MRTSILKKPYENIIKGLAGRRKGLNMLYLARYNKYNSTGSLSRILLDLEAEKIIKRHISDSNKRIYTLTEKGITVYNLLIDTNKYKRIT